MKNIYRFMSIAALVLVGAMMTNCSNDDNFIDEPQLPANTDNVVTLTTTISLDDGVKTRALTAAGVKTFAEGEQLALVYQNTSGETVKAVSSPLPAGIYDKSATFTFELTNPDKTQDVTYIYPAAMAKDDGSVNYDALATQDGTLTSLASNLDYCTDTKAWNGSSLPTGTLVNQLTILALTLKNSSGSSEITNTVTGLLVKVGAYSYAVSRSATAGPIYVAMRPTTSANIQITAAGGTNFYTKSLSDKTYSAGNGYNLALRMAAAPTAALTGQFSVSSTKKVYFSPGNLQATTYNNGTDWIWHFAPNQWDWIGSQAAANNAINGNRSVSVSGSVDLFRWSTSTTYYGIHNSTSNYTYSGDFVDWGETIGTGWRTLSNDEWLYLFSHSTYGSATVNDVFGFIILPVGYTGSPINTDHSLFYDNEFDASTWATYEAAGAVFMPVTGKLGETDYYNGAYGYYWTSTTASTSQWAYYLKLLQNASASTDTYSRKTGYAVRLVKYVN